MLKLFWHLMLHFNSTVGLTPVNGRLQTVLLDPGQKNQPVCKECLPLAIAKKYFSFMSVLGSKNTCVRVGVFKCPPPVLKKRILEVYLINRMNLYLFFAIEYILQFIEIWIESFIFWALLSIFELLLTIFKLLLIVIGELFHRFWELFWSLLELLMIIINRTISILIKILYALRRWAPRIFFCLLNPNPLIFFYLR